jgi:hypothetical protein
MTLNYYRAIISVNPNHFCLIEPWLVAFVLATHFYHFKYISQSNYISLSLRAGIKHIQPGQGKMKPRIDTSQNPAIRYFFYDTNRYKQILCDLSIFEDIDDLAFEISPNGDMQKPDKLVKSPLGVPA